MRIELKSGPGVQFPNLPDVLRLEPVRLQVIGGEPAYTETVVSVQSGFDLQEIPELHNIGNENT